DRNVTGVQTCALPIFNSLSIAPMIAETERLNEVRKRERKKIMAKLSALSKEIKQEKSPSEMASLFEEKEELEEKLEKLCDIVFRSEERRVGKGCMSRW